MARIIHGAQVSLQVGLISVSIAFVGGVLFGLLAGYYKGGVDAVLMRLVDIMFSLPGIVLAIIIAGLLGPNRRNAMIAIGIVILPAFARVVRGAVLEVMGYPYTESSRALGASSLRIMGKHVIPNISAPLLVLVSVYLSVAILAEAALSFLGLGTQPPEAAWGSMLGTARTYIDVQRRGCRSSPAPRSCSSCWASTCSATGCATSSIPGSARLSATRRRRRNRPVALDVLIRGGWVADGTGSPPYLGDVAIEGGKIVEVGRLGSAATRDRVLDASGKVVCPGFVDPHSHSDFSILANRPRESTIRQGVTTEVVGNCGWSYAPVTPHPSPSSVAVCTRSASTSRRSPGRPSASTSSSSRTSATRRTSPGSSATTRSGSRPASPGPRRPPSSLPRWRASSTRRCSPARSGCRPGSSSTPAGRRRPTS